MKDRSLNNQLPRAEPAAVATAIASKEPLRPSVANKNQRNFVVFQTGFRSLARRSFVNIGCALAWLWHGRQALAYFVSRLEATIGVRIYEAGSSHQGRCPGLAFPRLSLVGLRTGASTPLSGTIP